MVLSWGSVTVHLWQEGPLRTAQRVCGRGTESPQAQDPRRLPPCGHGSQSIGMGRALGMRSWIVLRFRIPCLPAMKLEGFSKVHPGNSGKMGLSCPLTSCPREAGLRRRSWSTHPTKTLICVPTRDQAVGALRVGWERGSDGAERCQKPGCRERGFCTDLMKWQRGLGL